MHQESAFFPQIIRALPNSFSKALATALPQAESLGCANIQPRGCLVHSENDRRPMWQKCKQQALLRSCQSPHLASHMAITQASLPGAHNSQPSSHHFILTLSVATYLPSIKSMLDASPGQRKFLLHQSALNLSAVLTVCNCSFIPRSQVSSWYYKLFSHRGTREMSTCTSFYLQILEYIKYLYIPCLLK